MTEPPCLLPLLPLPGRAQLTRPVFSVLCGGLAVMERLDLSVLMYIYIYIYICMYKRLTCFAQEIRGTLKKKRKDDDRKKRRRRVEKIYFCLILLGEVRGACQRLWEKDPIKVISMINKYLYILLGASKSLHRNFNWLSSLRQFYKNWTQKLK